MIRTYQDNDPKGWCGDPKRGAALGRYSIHECNRDYPTKLRLQHIPLDSGGYDCNGTYFGYGRRLYWYANDEGTIDATLRADNRDQAKAEILERYPHARFYR